MAQRVKFDFDKKSNLYLENNYVSNGHFMIRRNIIPIISKDIRKQFDEIMNWKNGEYRDGEWQRDVSVCESLIDHLNFDFYSSFDLKKFEILPRQGSPTQLNAYAWEATETQVFEEKKITEPCRIAVAVDYAPLMFEFNFAWVRDSRSAIILSHSAELTRENVGALIMPLRL